MDPMENVSIIINPRDNVATVRVPLIKGTPLTRDGKTIEVRDDIPFGHKLALSTIREGEFVIKFGDPIGRALRDIVPGEWVHIHNLESCRGRGSKKGDPDQVNIPHPYDTDYSSPVASSVLREVRATRDSRPLGDHVIGCDLTFLGYHRPDGSVGVRNHLIILPSVGCAGHIAALIAREVKEAIAIPNQHGCSQLGVDRDQTFRTLVGTATNPNVGAVLVVGLGCETISAPEIAHEVRKSGKPVELIVIQDAGGTRQATQQGITKAKELLRQISPLQRELTPIARLILGTECGGSDTCSGFSANPAVGFASDLLLQQGGTVILSETTEFIGAEHLLQKRAADEELGERILTMVRRVEQSAIDLGVDILGANPSPGNIAGGITTIEEKSLGCIYKSGTALINGVFAYAEMVRDKGLVIMDTPGNDTASVTGMAAGGAHLVVFTTGRGTPTGAPIVPVIKIATNSGLFGRMKDNLDINAGTIIDGEESIEEVGSRIFEAIVRVVSGEQTKAERWGHREFSIPRIAPTF